MTLQPSDRLHALDLVRACALILGILFHAGISFYPATDPLWLVMDTQRSCAIAWSGFVLHIFRMTTFFLLAGYFGRMVFHRKGAAWFLRSRAKRIGLPLLIFWPIMLVSFIILLVWGLVRQYGVDPKALPPGPPLTLETLPLSHLWFLYVLILFYIAILVLRLPLALLDRKETIRNGLADALHRLIATPFFPLLLAVPVMLTLLSHQGWIEWWGIPTPDHGLVPNLPSIVTYGLAFTLGWGLQRQENTILRLRKTWILSLISAIGATLICLYLLEGKAGTGPTLQGRPQLVFAAAYSLAIWYWTFAFIGIALQFVRQKNPVVRYIADSSYWLYIVHLPIIVALQIWIFDWNWPAEVKYAFILCTSLPIMLASYQILIRHTWIGNILNGPKRKEA